MLLPGRLSASTLGDLLGMLHRAGTTGQLELREISGPVGDNVPGRRHRITFAAGLVVGVETTLRVPPLGEIMRRFGLARGDAITKLIGRLDAGDRRPAGQILVAEGLARSEAVSEALRMQLRARIDALFALREAAISFHTARAAIGGGGAPVKPLGPREFLHGRSRARDRAGWTPPAPIAVDADESPRPSPTRKAPPRTNTGPKAAGPNAHEEREPPRSGVRERDLYEARAWARKLLGVGDGAGQSEVRRAFRRLASELHPDRFAAGRAEELHRRGVDFAQLSAAYHLLVA